jgi:hypothetical protein
MKNTDNIKLRIKIGFGVFAFIVSLLAIVTAFALSVGVLFDILLHSAFYLALLLGPLLFLGLFFLVVMLLSTRWKKWITLVIGITFSVFGLFDILVKSLSSSQSIPLVKLAGNESSSETLPEYSPPVAVNVSYDNEEDYFKVSETLGYVPAANRITQSSETWNGKKIFDVQYTIGESGLRIAPPFKKNENTRSLLFFGCSTTFGYGLPDHQTFPYRVGLKTDGKYKIFNFAFNGYGTHHMVAALESDFVEKRVDVTPEHIFYLATPLHMEWIQNRKNWGKHDPMYTLDENKRLVFEGHFDESAAERVKSFLFDCQDNYEQLRLRSYLLQLVDPLKDPYHKRYSHKEQDLFIALVKRATTLAAKKYPAAKFHVIYWPMNTTEENRIIQQLDQNGFDYYLISDIIPNYHSDFRNYWINYPADAHPNALATQIISDFIVRDILNKNEDQL